MIGSVVAKLNGQPHDTVQIIQEITARSGFEVGDVVDRVMLPVTIDLPGEAEEMERATRWLQSLEGVESVDVVFVHFENECDRP